MTVSALTSLPPAPASALGPDGAPRFGAYAGEISGAAEIGRARGIAGCFAARFRRKRWLYIGVYGPRVFAGMAVVDAGYLGKSFAYVFERGPASHAAGQPDPRFVEYVHDSPLALGFRVAGGLSDAVARSSKVHLRAEPDGFYRASVRVPDSIELDLRVGPVGTPLTVLSDMGGGAHGATAKFVGVAVEGTLRARGREVSLEGVRAVIDWTCARFPYDTRWNWAAAAGVGTRGEAVGLNLCRGVHEDLGGRYTEDALWLDGRPGALPPVRFTVGRKTPPGDPWKIEAGGGLPGGGEVALEFRPLGERAEDLNYGLVSSRFRQAFGTFHGRVRDRDGRAAELDGTPGVVEDHAARW